MLAGPPGPTVSAPRPEVPAGGIPSAEASVLDPHGDEARRLMLKKLPSGKYLYVGTQDERFDAKVNPDGTVTFMVDPNFQVQLGGICLVAICVSRTPGRGPANPTKPTAAQKVARTGKQIAAGLVAGAAGALAKHYRGNDYGVQLPPNWMEDPNRYNNPPAPVLGGIHGRYGYLPTPNAQMAAFLERTFAFRLQLAKEDRAKRLAKALKELPVRLLDTWSDRTMTVAERKAEILALWAELERPAGDVKDTPLAQAARDEVDVRRSEAAAEARKKITEFVNRHLPASSADAYTRSELDRFNAAQGPKAKFEPYRK